MEKLDAYNRLKAMTAADSEPLLDHDELELLLEQFRRADSDDREIGDADWVPTWDLNAAAAEGWTWKAGKVAADFSFSSDNQRFDRSDMTKHCQSMAERYRRRGAFTITLGSTMAGPR